MPDRKMTDEEMLANMRDGTPLNRARQAFRAAAARIEQAGAQRSPLAPLDMCRMEFEAVSEIASRMAEVPGLGSGVLATQAVTAEACASFLEEIAGQAAPAEREAFLKVAHSLRGADASSIPGKAPAHG